MKYAIIGAGIGGLTTALAFEQKGIDYQIFEKVAQIKEVGAGIWLAPNALQVLDFLSVLGDVKMNGNVINRITLGKQNLSPLSDNDQESVVKKFGFSTIAIHRALLQKILLKKIPQEKIHLGKAFQSFETLADEKIKINFEDQSQYETEFLIGADGINSKVRNQLFPKSTIRYSGQTCWRGVADYTIHQDFKHRGVELWGNQIRFGFSKISEDKVYWFAVALDKPNGKDDREVIKETLLSMYSKFHPMITEIISSTNKSKIVRNDITDLKPLENWYKNNICLIGDAGHATTPNMGQGGAQAIEDAYYLSQLIQPQSKDNVFGLFQQKRKAKVASIVNQSWTTGKIAHWKYGRGFRDFLLQNIPKKIVQQKMMDMYEIEKQM